MSAGYRASNSQFTVLSSCEYKYWHRYVNKTPEDKDFKKDYKAFIIGRITHRHLENMAKKLMCVNSARIRKSLDKDLSNLSAKKSLCFLDNIIANLIEEEANKDERYRLDYVSFYKDKVSVGNTIATLYFLSLWVKEVLYPLCTDKSSNVKVVFSEKTVKDEFNHIVADLGIVIDDHLWIFDAKTGTIKNEKSTSYDPKISTLQNDPQMLLYATFSDHLCKDYPLGGVGHLVINKPLAKDSTVKKLNAIDIAEKTINNKDKGLYNQVRLYIVGKENMDMDNFRENYIRTYKRGLSIRENKSGDNLIKNRNSCMGLLGSSPCEYWSFCHGSLYTEGKGVKISGDEKNLNSAIKNKVEKKSLFDKFL